MRSFFLAILAFTFYPPSTLPVKNRYYFAAVRVIQVSLYLPAGGRASHADDVYRAFHKQKHGADLGTYDFYYQIVAARQFSPRQNWCTSNFDFFGGLVGWSSGSFSSLTLNMSYVYDAGRKSRFSALTCRNPHGENGQTSGAATPGSGCYFQITPAFQTPQYLTVVGQVRIHSILILALPGNRLQI